MFTIADNQFNVYESEVLRTPQYLLTCAYFSYFGFKKKTSLRRNEMDYFKVALCKMNTRIKYTQTVAPFPDKSIKHDSF